jgi:peptidyl-dipeptidase A
MTSNHRRHRSARCVAALFLGLAVGMQAGATEESAREFIARINAELAALRLEVATASWVQATYITPDTNFLAAKANEKLLAFNSRAIAESARYLGQELDTDTARQLALLRRGATLPAPGDAAKRAELATLATEMEALYGTAKVCPEGEECLSEADIIRIMASERDYQRLFELWQGWHDTAQPARPMFERFVELANEGAREIGFANLGELWKSGYDMSPEAFEAEAERLWRQVEPLYEQLHCHVRDKLADHYGEDKVPRSGPIPAHLLGNIWAQQWGNLYELVEPVPGVAQLDISSALVEQGWDEARMTRAAENFFVSLGMPALPDSFWELSLLKQPRDRDVVCHASAWSMDGADDVRTAGHTGPLHECSIFGNKEAGRRLIAMLELGASKPWPDALELITGSREMDASAIIDYFQPLMRWLETQNAGRNCGW